MPSGGARSRPCSRRSPGRWNQAPAAPRAGARRPSGQPLARRDLVPRRPRRGRAPTATSSAPLRTSTSNAVPSTRTGPCGRADLERARAPPRTRRVPARGVTARRLDAQPRSAVQDDADALAQARLAPLAQCSTSPGRDRDARVRGRRQGAAARTSCMPAPGDEIAGALLSPARPRAARRGRPRQHARGSDRQRRARSAAGSLRPAGAGPPGPGALPSSSAAVECARTGGGGGAGGRWSYCSRWPAISSNCWRSAGSRARAPSTRVALGTRELTQGAGDEVGVADGAGHRSGPLGATGSGVRRVGRGRGSQPLAQGRFRGRCATLDGAHRNAGDPRRLRVRQPSRRTSTNTSRSRGESAGEGVLDGRCRLRAREALGGDCRSCLSPSRAPPRGTCRGRVRAGGAWPPRSTSGASRSGRARCETLPRGRQPGGRPPDLQEHVLGEVLGEGALAAQAVEEPHDR